MGTRTRTRRWRHLMYLGRWPTGVSPPTRCPSTPRPSRIPAPPSPTSEPELELPGCRRAKRIHRVFILSFPSISWRLASLSLPIFGLIFWSPIIHILRHYDLGHYVLINSFPGPRRLGFGSRDRVGEIIPVYYLAHESLYAETIFEKKS